eukprot:173442-Chlamydomonas_euryale.AAC.3
MSPSGQHITAVGFDGLYVSSDYGKTFTQKAASLSSTKFLQGIAMSADGAIQTTTSGAVGGIGSIYVSTDGGLTWPRSTSGITDLEVYFRSVAMSHDGAVQTVLVSPGFIYVSSDSGASWTQKTTLGTADYYHVAMSSTGATQLVCQWNSKAVWRSTDSGSTFNSVSVPVKFSQVAMSYDGAIQYGVNGGLYKSTDSGVSFKQLTGPLSLGVICTNSDGSVVLMADYYGTAVFVSTDGVKTLDQTYTGGAQAMSCAMNSDGTRMVISMNSRTYMSTDFGSTWSRM